MQVIWQEMLLSDSAGGEKEGRSGTYMQSIQAVCFAVSLNAKLRFQKLPD